MYNDTYFQRFVCGGRYNNKNVITGLIILYYTHNFVSKTMFFHSCATSKVKTTQ